MDAQLKRIEEKLDVLLAVMSANPEYESFVKEGRIKLHMARFEKDLAARKIKQAEDKLNYVWDIVRLYSESHKVFLLSYREPVNAFHYREDAPPYAKEVITELMRRLEKVDWDFKKLEGDFAADVITLEDFCPLMEAQLNTVFGESIDVETELEKERLRYLEEIK